MSTTTKTTWSGTLEFTPRSGALGDGADIYKWFNGKRVLVGTVRATHSGRVRSNVGGMTAIHQSMSHARRNIARYCGATGTITVLDKGGR
jgi:hypothetical protein